MHMGFSDDVALLGTRLAADHFQKMTLVVTFHADDGMDDEMDRVALAVKVGSHGVHEERHIVVDYLDDGVGGPPPLLVHPGIDDPDFRGSRLALFGKFPQTQSGAIEIFRRALRQVFRCCTLVKEAHKLFN